jgi:hypothetical protein
VGTIEVASFVIAVLSVALAAALSALVVQHRAARLKAVLLRAGELARTAGLAVDAAEEEVRRATELVREAGEARQAAEAERDAALALRTGPAGAAGVAGKTGKTGKTGRTGKTGKTGAAAAGA